MERINDVEMIWNTNFGGPVFLQNADFFRNSRSSIFLCPYIMGLVQWVFLIMGTFRYRFR